MAWLIPASAALDLDLLFRLHHLRALRQRDGQHALIEARLDLILVDVSGSRIERWNEP